MSSSIEGDLCITIDGLRARLAEAEGEIKAFKAKAKHASAGLGGQIFDDIKESAKELGKVGFSNLTAAFGVGAGAVGFLEFLKSAAEKAHEIQHTAETLNESAEAVQRVQKAAEIAGVDVTSLRNAFIKLEASAANPATAKAFDDLGISGAALVGMPIDEKIIALADAFEAARARGTGVHDIMELLGKSAKDLIPLLARGGKELREMFNRNVIAEADIEAMARLNEQWKEMEDGSKRAGMQATAAMYDTARAVGSVIEKMLEGKGAVGSFADTMNERLDEIHEREQKNQTRLIDQAKAKKALEQLEQSERLDGLKKSVHKDEEENMSPEKKFDALQEDKDRAWQNAEKALPEYGAVFDQDGMNGNDPKNLKRFAEGAEAYGADKKAEIALKAYKEILEINREMDRISKESAERHKREAEETEKGLQTLRDETDKNAMKLLPPKEAARLLREEMAKTFGLSINSNSDVENGLEGLKKKVSEAHEAGNSVGEKAALEKLKKFQEESQELGSLAPHGRGEAHGQGETASALNILTGQSDNLVYDEAKRQTDVLHNIQRAIEAQNKPGDTHGLSNGAHTKDSAFGHKFEL